MAAGEEQWQIFPDEPKLQTSLDHGPPGRIIQRLSTALQRIFKMEIEEEIGSKIKEKGEVRCAPAEQNPGCVPPSHST